MNDIRVEYVMREAWNKYPVYEGATDYYVEGWADAVEFIADKLGINLDEPSD